MPDTGSNLSPSPSFILQKCVTVVHVAISVPVNITTSHPSVVYGVSVLPPRGGLGVPTDRDQRSWVFLGNPKKYFGTERKCLKKYFAGSRDLTGAGHSA